MRLIAGGECGLLKEILPELPYRAPPEDDDDGGASEPLLPSNMSAPVASSSGEGVCRIDEGEVQSRGRGLVGAGFVRLPPPANDDDCDEDEDEDDEDEGRDDGGGATFGFCSLRADGSVETWECRRRRRRGGRYPGRYRRVCAVGGVFAADGEGGPVGRPIGLATRGGRSQTRGGGSGPSDSDSDGGGGGGGGLTAALDSIGNLSLLDSLSPDRGVVARYDAFGSKGGGTISYTKGNSANKDAASAVAMDGRGARIAVGGRERETAILDAETGGRVWKAKNLKPDLQTLLQHPVWSTALEFLPLSSSSSGGPSDLLAVGTAYRQVRVYDVRSSGRRPSMVTPDGLVSHRVTALCELGPNSVAVGDAAGYLHSLDLRRIASLPRSRSGEGGWVGTRGGGGVMGSGNSNASGGWGERRYVGPAGSVRCVVRHPDPAVTVMASVGLDRTLRTYDVGTRRMTGCVYLRQRLNCALFCDDGAWGKYDGENEEGDGGGGGGRGGLVDGDGDQDEEDRVEDYVDSDQEGGEDDVAAAGGGRDAGGDSDSEDDEDDNDDDDDDSDESDGDHGDESHGNERDVSDDDEGGDSDGDGSGSGSGSSTATGSDSDGGGDASSSDVDGDSSDGDGVGAAAVVPGGRGGRRGRRCDDDDDDDGGGEAEEATRSANKKRRT